MINETSAGIVFFRTVSEKNQFLLLHYPQGHWDFVKGKIEKNEKVHETARREAKEETAITNFQLMDGFEEYVEYQFRLKNEIIYKKVIFFLGKTNTKKIQLSHEHIGYIWLDYNNTLKKLTFENAKNVLIKANEFLLNARQL